MSIDNPIWLKHDFILKLHARQLVEHGGTAGIRDGERIQSNDSRFLQRNESTVLVDRFQRAAGKLHADPAVLLGNPNPLRLQIRRDFTLYRFRHVTTNPAFFLSET